jgi:hypothetical protein
MGGECSMHGRDEECVQNFRWKALQTIYSPAVNLACTHAAEYFTLCMHIGFLIIQVTIDC